MCRRVRPAPCLSATSSQLGQITSPEPPIPCAGDRATSPPPPNRAAEDDDGQAAKRARIAADGGGGGGGGDGRDRISDLPEGVQLAILSLLPLPDAGRTAVLSSRWRRLFAESLVDLRALQPWPPERRYDSQWLIGAVSAILDAHPVPIRSFHVSMFGAGFAGSEHVVDGWLRALAQRAVQELNVFMLYANRRQALPPSILEFPSLKTLKACNCTIPRAAAAAANAPPPQLPSLKMLDLSYVDLSEASLDAVLAHCVSLEVIKLKNIRGISRIRLRSRSLKSLFGDFDYLDELVVEDAPKLQRLVGIRMPHGEPKLKIVHAPELEVLGCLGTSLELRGALFIAGTEQLRSLMCSVKTLAIQAPFSAKGYAMVVTRWLRCFPCLEVLSVEADGRSVYNSVGLEEWETTSTIECLDRRLERVVLDDYGGQACQWGFVCFLLAMARALKTVEFYCLRGFNEDWARAQRDSLCNQTIASVGSQFLFFRRSTSVHSLYLCHCCEQHCEEELYRLNRRFLI